MPDCHLGQRQRGDDPPAVLVQFGPLNGASGLLRTEKHGWSVAPAKKSDTYQEIGHLCLTTPLIAPGYKFFQNIILETTLRILVEWRSPCFVRMATEKAGANKETNQGVALTEAPTNGGQQEVSPSHRQSCRSGGGSRKPSRPSPSPKVAQRRVAQEVIAQSPIDRRPLRPSPNLGTMTVAWSGRFAATTLRRNARPTVPSKAGERTTDAQRSPVFLFPPDTGYSFLNTST